MRVAAVAGCLIVIAVPSARAEPPSRTPCGLVEPAQVSLRESGLDTPRSACPDSISSAFARSIAAIDSGDFYGTISGSLLLRARYQTRAGIELEAGARVFDYRFAQNAVLTDDEYSVGPIVLGVAHGENVSWFGRSGRWAAQLRFEIPRTNTGLDLTAISASPAFVWTARVGDRWRLHSRLAMLLWSARTSRAIDTRFGALAGIDGTARFGRAFGVSVGAEGQGGWHGGPLDHILARTGVSYGTRTQVSLAIGVPFLGDERANASVSIGLARKL